VLIPFYHLNDKLELVRAYTYVHSVGVDGARFARYASRIEEGRGDNDNDFFLGLDWFIYGHDFKLQTGVEYALMDDAARDGGFPELGLDDGPEAGLTGPADASLVAIEGGVVAGVWPRWRARPDLRAGYRTLGPSRSG